MPLNEEIPFIRPKFHYNLQVSNEESVRYALWMNVIETVQHVAQRNMDQFDFWPTFVHVKGNPDFVLFSLLTRKIMFPIVVKTTSILPQDNIVEILDDEDPPLCVTNSIRQIFGYMVQNRSRYGVLSTYDKTWFLRRHDNDSGTLFISDVVNILDTNPTLIRCFAYIMSLARDDEEDCEEDCAYPPPLCPFPPPSRPPSPEYYEESPDEEDDDSENEDPTYEPPKSYRSRKGTDGAGIGNAGQKGNTSKRNQPNTKRKRPAMDNKLLNTAELWLEKFDWDSFEVTEVIGEGRCGQVFEGTLRGERAVVKLTDLWQHPELHQEMLREASVYVHLEKLQGLGIPKLMGVGYTASGLFALMTEFGGSPIKVWRLNNKMREMIVGVLAGIHAEGFLHGDVRCDNILVEFCDGGPRITFIDFGLSRKFSRLKESVREMAALKEMIGFPKTDSRRE
jgi:tRNA A-37 threonylcarbamoyl transferase component Bud32